MLSPLLYGFCIKFSYFSNRSVFHETESTSLLQKLVNEFLLPVFEAQKNVLTCLLPFSHINVRKSNFIMISGYFKQWWQTGCKSCQVHRSSLNSIGLYKIDGIHPCRKKLAKSKPWVYVHFLCSLLLWYKLYIQSVVKCGLGQVKAFKIFHVFSIDRQMVMKKQTILDNVLMLSTTDALNKTMRGLDHSLIN